MAAARHAPRGRAAAFAFAFAAALGPARSASPDAGPAPAPPEISVALVGDVMLGSTFPDPADLPPQDGAGLLAEVGSLLKGADLALGNLEGPLVDAKESTKCRGRKPGSCYAFAVPTRYGRLLEEAGFDGMGLANNHALDFGPEGLESTRRVLGDLRIGHSGPRGEVARFEVKGRRVAFVAFATYEGMYDLTDLDDARRVVGGLAADGATVVVSFHGGAEGLGAQHVPRGTETFYSENRGSLRAFAHAVVDAGAALVFGHGPHVVRGMEVYRGRLVAYSLGNFATWSKFNLSGPLGLSLVLTVRLAPDGSFLGGRVHPIRQLKPGGPRLDPDRAVLPLLRALSAEDFGEAAVRVAEDGAILPPAIR